MYQTVIEAVGGDDRVKANFLPTVLTGAARIYSKDLSLLSCQAPRRLVSGPCSVFICFLTHAGGRGGEGFDTYKSKNISVGVLTL
jgi:hypothetical protein